MKLIPLSRGLFAKVSDRDYARLSKHKWSVHPSGRQGKLYAARAYKGGKILMHHEVKSHRKNMDLDHQNNDGLDNRRSNLRYKTRSQNCHAARADNHPMQGIYPRRNKFLAKVCVNYIQHSRSFDTIEEAQAWRRSMKP